MKNSFSEHHVSDKGELEEFLKTSTIVLDTNALLDLYRLNKENRDKYFEVLSNVKDRLHLTYHIGHEFYKNKEIVIASICNMKKDLKKYLEEELTKIENKLKNSNFNNNASLLKYEKQLQEVLIENLTLFKEESLNTIDEKNQFINGDYLYDKDEILYKINEIYEGKIGKKIEDEELEKIYIEGEKRYEGKIPPGYSDVKDKKGNEKFGDLIIWKELIEFSQETKNDVLLISRDRKPDWCYKLNGYDLGPRKELLSEFKKETGQRFFSLTVSHFIDKVSQIYSINDTLELTKEIKELVDKIEDLNNSKGTWENEEVDYYFELLNENRKKVIELEISKKKYRLDMAEARKRDDTETETEYYHIIEEINNEISKLEEREVAINFDLGMAMQKM